jgi:hypothetical protein
MCNRLCSPRLNYTTNEMEIARWGVTATVVGRGKTSRVTLAKTAPSIHEDLLAVHASKVAELADVHLELVALDERLKGSEVAAVVAADASPATGPENGGALAVVVAADASPATGPENGGALAAVAAADASRTVNPAARVKRSANDTPTASATKKRRGGSAAASALGTMP